MTAVTYIEHNGTEHKVDVPEGDSVMQGAVNNAIEGIVGECGGGLACATCLCFVDPAWVDRVGEPSEMEKQMLEFAPNGDQARQPAQLPNQRQRQAGWLGCAPARIAVLSRSGQDR